MMSELTPLQWLAFILGSLGAVVFGLLTIWAFISLIILGWRGLFGMKIKYDHEKIPEAYRQALEPVKAKHSKPKESNKSGD